MLFWFVFLGLMWGSFLNLLGYRLLSGDSLLGARSCCVHCKKIIPWYHLIPVVSFCLLQGQSQCCRKPISWIYPVIEILGGVAGAALWYDMVVYGFVSPSELVMRGCAYGVLLSGFIVATRTDLQALVVPRIVIFGMALAGVAAGLLRVLPVTVMGSVVGGISGYFSLWLLNYASRRLIGQDGIGEGDMELLAVIGIYWGIIGVWGVAFMSSILGTLCAVVYLILTGQGRHTRIPFIPFMAVSSIAYLFLQQFIIEWLWAL